MTEDEGTVAHHVVEVGVAVHVEDARSLAAFHEQRVSTDRAKRPHGAVHATRHQPDSPLHQPRRTVPGENRPRVYALSALLQMRQLPSLRPFEVYYPGTAPTMTEITPNGKAAGRPHPHAQRCLFGRNPARTSNPPTASKSAPITAQNSCPVMKLPGSIPMPCNSQTPPMRIISPPRISST